MDEIVASQLALSVFPQVLDFPGEAVLELVEEGLYRKGLRVPPRTAQTPEASRDGPLGGGTTRPER